MNLTDRVAKDRGRSLKDDLLRPRAYAALAKSRSVELVETHISWVFLLEHDVFKLKKPVNLGFLDFRTLEQRRAACEAEVVFNRRLAPDVYRGVVPVRRGGDGRAHLGTLGPIVDYAVRMVRLPDASRADHLLHAGQMTSKTVDSIARCVAEFHARCSSNATTARFGSAAVIEQNLEENFAQTRGSLDRYLRPGEADELVRWQRAFLRGHAALFEARAAAGRVRDGHGDLRLEHVYLEDGRPTILDCIEFNERFRFADVCADVAFLSMDLVSNGRADLAERLLASYARESNDFDLYSVVDFYESYRAYVRGKIAAMLADDASVDEATRTRAAREARRFFLLALSAHRRGLLLPSVVAVGGVIASGKSTLADFIGAEMSAPVIEADRTRKAMLGVEPTHRIAAQAWSGAYDPAFTEHVYDEVLRRAGVVLASGRPVVIDASFRSSAMRRAAREMADFHGVPFRFVECRAPAHMCKERLTQRQEGQPVSDGRVGIFDEFCARYEAVTELPSSEYLSIDTSRPLEENLETLRASLDTWPRGFGG
jgi:aminoglycoside phosphotransferase family enzyme/predicted kinase